MNLVKNPERKEKAEKRLNKVLTVLVIVAAIICLSVCVKVISGKDASIFGFQIYHILTGSMEPTIPTGSNVLVHEVDPATLKEGDVITFTSRDASIYGSANTHRIIGITEENGQKKFITKGDANSRADAITVAMEDVKGKVVFHVNSAAFTSFFEFIHTGPGFVTVIVMPVLFICWCILQDFKRQLEDLKKENEKSNTNSEN